MNAEEAKFYVFLGRRIKDFRKEMKCSQERLGRLLGVSRVNITNIEAGRQRVTLWSLVKLMNFFHVEPSIFLK